MIAQAKGDGRQLRTCAAIVRPTCCCRNRSAGSGSHSGGGASGLGLPGPSDGPRGFDSVPDLHPRIIRTIPCDVTVLASVEMEPIGLRRPDAPHDWYAQAISEPCFVVDVLALARKVSDHKARTPNLSNDEIIDLTGMLLVLHTRWLVSSLRDSRLEPVAPSVCEQADLATAQDKARACPGDRPVCRKRDVEAACNTQRRDPRRTPRGSQGRFAR